MRPKELRQSGRNNRARLADALAALRAGWRLLAAPLPMRLSEWATEHFYLSAESSYSEQKWHAWPYQRAILDCMGHDSIEEIAFRKAARLGFTKMTLAAMFYFAQHLHRNQVVYQPTSDDSDDFCKTELEPALRDVPIMLSTFPQAMQRHKDNTLRLKRGIGCSLHLRGGAAATNYRRLTVDVVHIDEVDAFAADVEGEGNPVALARNRIAGALFGKLIVGSTPKTKGLSLIEAREQQAGARFEFRIPCIHCGDLVPLAFGGPGAAKGLRWPDGAPEAVTHICVACGEPFTQGDYFAQWERGRWVADDGTTIDAGCVFRDGGGSIVPAPRSVAFRLWAAYSPQISWPSIARQYASAQAKAIEGDTSELKTFHNQTLGETWEEQTEKVHGHELQARAEDYPLRVVPAAAAILTAGVDVQEDRFEAVVYAWAPGNESWAIAHEIIVADTALPESWAQLGAFLDTGFDCADGGRATIRRAAVDCGFRSYEAYAFCRARLRRGTLAVKGHQVAAKPILRESFKVDVNAHGKTIPGGLVLWLIGTDNAKDLLHDRLRLKQAGAGFIHLSEQLPDEFFAGMASEQRSRVKTSRGVVSRWTKRPGGRNEAWDCSVYALAAALHLRVPTVTPAQWASLREAQGRGRPTEAPEVPAAKPPKHWITGAPLHRPAPSWVKGWRP